MWPQQHHGKSLSSLNYDDDSLTCTESEYLPSSRTRLRVRLKILVTNRHKLLTQKFVTKIVNEKSGSNGGLHFLTFLIGGVAFAGGYYAFQKYRRRLIPTPTQYIGKNHIRQI